MSFSYYNYPQGGYLYPLLSPAREALAAKCARLVGRNPKKDVGKAALVGDPNPKKVP